MHTSGERPVIDETLDSTDPNETMSGVGVPARDATVEGLGFDGREDDAPLTDDEHPSEERSDEDRSASTPPR